MAFTGTPVVVQVSDSIMRITGVSLAAGASGTIGLDENSGAPGVRLPEGFQPAIYEGPTGAPVALSDSLDVSVKAAAVGVATAIPVAVVKTGTGQLHWLATITNTHGSLATPNLEIYVKFHN